MRGGLLRLLVLGLVSVQALALAGSAPGVAGTRAAQLVVVAWDSSPGRRSDVALLARASPEAAAPARLTVYVPSGYGLTSGAPGAHVGLAVAWLVTAAGPSSPLVDVGEMTSIDPASLANDPAAQACSPGPHAAVWAATLTFETQPLRLRIYVDPTQGDEVSAGAFRLIVCLPSPYVSAAQGGAPAGAQLDELDLFSFTDSQPLFTNPEAAGAYTWRMLVTPYVAGTATPDTAGTFEARARVLLPHVVTERASYTPKTHMLLVSGRLLGLGKPRAGIGLTFYAGKPNDVLRLFGAATTRADGSYSLRKRVKQQRRARTLEIGLEVAEVPGPCGEPAIVAGGCVDETLSPPGFATKKVRIPAAK